MKQGFEKQQLSLMHSWWNSLSAPRIQFYVFRRSKITFTKHYLAASCHKSRKIDISDVCMTYWLSNPKTIICMYIYLFTFNKIYSIRTGRDSESKYCIWLFQYTDKPRKKSFRFQQSRIDNPTKFWNFILLICVIAVK